MCEIKIERDVVSDFLLKLHVNCVDTRIGVVLAERTHAAEAWEGVSKRPSSRETANCRARTRCRRNQTWPSGAHKRIGKETAGNCLLLHAVGGNRLNLRQHILAGVINTVAGPQHRGSLSGNVPGKAGSWLKLFLWTVLRT